MFKFTPLFWNRKRHTYFNALTHDDRRRKLRDLLLLLLLAGVTHTGLIAWFEGLSLWDSFWLTMTTMTTVGYGDASAKTVGGQIGTIVLMYIFGIFLLAQIAGEWIDFRLDRRERMRKGLWRWNMQNHILILNTPDSDGERYLQIFIEQIRASTSLADYPIQIFSPRFPDGLPSSLARQGAVLHHAIPEGRGSLAEGDVASAAFVIVMAVDAQDFRSDSVTLDILDQLKAFQLSGHVIAECVLDENRERFRGHGADAVIRPVRAYPELMVRAMAAPGTEVILENLFQHDGVRPERYDIAFALQPWGQLAARVIEAGHGTPMGYVDADGNIVTNPVGNLEVEGNGLFLMVGHDRQTDEAALRVCVEPPVATAL